MLFLVHEAALQQHTAHSQLLLNRFTSTIFCAHQSQSLLA